jgi:MSHA pilin protein MshD
VSSPRPTAGFTLVELVVSIVVISVAISGVVGILSAVSARSGAAIAQAEATEIASAYLNEVLQRSFSDPDATPVEPARSLFDDVGDYNGLTDVGARDQFNQAIPGLTQFTVSVQVVVPAAGALGTVPTSSMKRVDVTVSHPTGVRVLLSGYRTAY